MGCRRTRGVDRFGGVSPIGIERWKLFCRPGREPFLVSVEPLFLDAKCFALVLVAVLTLASLYEALVLLDGPSWTLLLYGVEKLRSVVSSPRPSDAELSLWTRNERNWELGEA
jgi:hypothetical protein